MGLILCLCVLGSSPSTGVMGAYHVSGYFDASIAAPGIAIGDVDFNTATGLLSLPGDTDLTLVTAIRQFSTTGQLVNEIQVHSGTSGITAIPGASGDFYLTGENSIYRVDAKGMTKAVRTLDDHVVSPAAHNLAAIASDPFTGNVWVAESSSPYRLMELDQDLSLIRSIDMMPLLGSQGIPGEAGVIALEIDPLTGNFLLSGAFGKSDDNSILWQILEVDRDFTTVLSRFTGWPAGEWDSITGVSLDPATRRLFAVSGSSDFVFELSLRPGDANSDALIDGADYTIWADNFLQSGAWSDGDFNGDGLIDGADYTEWADSFSPGQLAEAMAVPEPSALLLAVVGFAVLLSGSVRLFRTKYSCPAAIEPGLELMHKPLA